MKKVLTLILALALCFGITACGSKNDDGDKKDGADGSEVKKIEKTVDAVAEELELGEGTETLYQMIGAEAGKEYKDGEVELYLFDEKSDEYKAIADGEGSLEAAAVNDGMIILTEDESLAGKFKDIKFK